MPPLLGLIVAIAPIAAAAIPAAAGLFGTIGLVAQGASMVANALAPPQKAQDSGYSQEDKDRAAKNIRESKDIIATSSSVSRRIGKEVLGWLDSVQNPEWRPPPSNFSGSSVPRGLLA